MEQTINSASQQGIIIDKESKITGERTLNNSHKTIYVIYDGNDTSGDINESIKIIGETWNCGISGSSIICIGYAQITNYSNNNSNVNLFFWKEIIGDRQGTFGLDFVKNNGLLFNVKCH